MAADRPPHLAASIADHAALETEILTQLLSAESIHQALQIVSVMTAHTSWAGRRCRFGQKRKLVFVFSGHHVDARPIIP